MGKPFERWGQGTVAYAEETRAWIESQRTEPDDDAVWEYVTRRWPGLSTGAAEHVLNLAMAAPSPSAPNVGALRAALTSALMRICDGTHGDDPTTWSLEVGPGLPGGTVAGLIDTLSESLPGLLRGEDGLPSPVTSR